MPSKGDKGEEYNLEATVINILESCIFNITHSIVLEIHRKEKQLLATLDPKTNIPLCPACSLPRLLDPPLSISRPEKSTQYCSHVPWSRKTFHDIYGNPFPVQGSEKPMTKKEKEARAKADREAKKRDRDRRDGSPKDTLNIAGGPIDKKSAKVDEKLKSGNYTPWHTCPSCKRSLLITRFAQHLEKCLGIGGRGRAVRDKENANSSAGTPARDVDEDDDDDEEDRVRKRSSKKSKEKKGHLLSLKSAKVKSHKNDSKTPDGRREKREREDAHTDDEKATPLRKKQKLVRTGSTASLLGSQVMNAESVAGSLVGDSIAGDTQGSVGDADGDGQESVDGSFVQRDEDDDDEDGNEDDEDDLDADGDADGDGHELDGDGADGAHSEADD